METALRAGIAIYNAGDYHEAHDAWEDHWLGLSKGTDDERFLHGLIQFTAAVHHATACNWAGATGLAESARAYLDGLPGEYRGVALGPVRTFLAALDADPERLERRAPPRLAHEGAVVTLDTLEFSAAAVAATVYAAEREYDEGVVEQAVAYAEADLADGHETSDFVTFVADFARDEAHRGIIFQRLSERVERRRRREGDVEGLFGDRE